ncbi:uncharacterized protein K452DRAFT_224185 [Aplosporella prunicola CBS 121167]|uniref:DNA-directed RNA polymerase n=1 Tax=Aplosporella prunicola CBS 121167 TaxID=1176127 RepID=A0A6A6BKG1_9PEZI|nr:uncharacterized protein K452DRAFT_224185 [Aplosporella prunicola CBS 121167]KAF2143873.1 hypothetical protein K452DRAFT_224185 [Aplosporella prunicola CBS 121167]
MLARAASRRSQRHAFRRLTSQANQLHLPWLCPAVTAPSRRGNASMAPNTPDAGNRSQQTKSRPVATSQTRSLATAAENVQVREDPAPFQQYSTGDMPHDTHDFRVGWSKPLIVNNSFAQPLPRLQYFNGIGGEPAELHSNLHACIRVGRYDRAASLVRRMRELYHPTAPELLEANNVYILTIVEKVIEKHPDYNINMLNAWLEVEMRDNDIQPNAVTYACMLKAAIATTSGSIMERLVRRYLGLAEQAGEDVLRATVSSEAYTDAEYAVISELRPDLIKGPGLSEAIAEAEGSAGLLGPNYGSTQGFIEPAKDTLPEIRAVFQKGAGLRTVKEALSIFTTKEELEKQIPYPHDMDHYSKEEKDYYFNRLRQDRLEEDSIDAAINRWREENQNMQRMGITSALQTKPMEALMWQWYTALVPLFEEELKNIKVAYADENTDPHDDRLHIGPFMEAFTPEKLAATCLIITVSSFGNPDQFEGVKLSWVAVAIGKQLALEHAIAIRDTLANPYSSYQRISARRLNNLIKPLKTEEAASTEQNEAGAEEQEEAAKEEALKMQEHAHKSLDWSPVVKAKIGALCLSKILEGAKIPISRKDKDTQKQLTAYQPAFSHSTMYVGGRKVGMVKLHPNVMEKLMREPIRGSFGTKYPMVVEPLPWTGYRQGGYLRYPEPIIKDKNQDDAQRIYAMAAADRGDMKEVMAGLTVLGKTAWRINPDVFKVVIEAWNTGEKIGKIAPENPRLEYPEEPGPDATRQEYAMYLREKRRVDNEKSGYHSQRCFQNFQLEVARAFKDEIIYFPHNMDFRGRAYPIPPLLNHLGADLARGLLTFAKGKELGSTGLGWLKIHLSNVYGFDKASLRDREQFAVDHLDDIYDSCNNPLGGKRWWLTAEDPWQCLATCYELKAALESPDPTLFKSSLPVHQDGTCNGLQHYAALGGDKAGAAQVNLEPGDKPSDIYSAVAELVKTFVAQDAAVGNIQAKKLTGKINRKVVKQTVMTNVYGVTFTGARAQVVKQLESIFTEEDKVDELPGGIFGLGSYVARLIFKALGQMFNGAQEIQNWLGACANRIATSLTPEQLEKIAIDWDQNTLGEGEVDETRYKKAQRKYKKAQKALAANITNHFRATVIWTTPLKMPVVQPYRQQKSKEISTVLQYLNIVQPKATDAIDKRKQLQAFPPNFIHSLDATHMLLSALKSSEIGLTFASVHDSFWTHAADIPIMNRVLRDAFVRMHSEDIVGRLHEEFQVRYKGHMYLASVPTTSPLGKRIMKWRQDKKAAQTTKTRNMLIDELLIERQRQMLLASENPEEQAKGKEMSTPASLYDEAKETEAIDLDVDEEAPISKLGETEVGPPSTKKSSAAAQDSAEDAVGMDDDVVDLMDPVLGEERNIHDDLPGEPDVEPVEHEKPAAVPAKRIPKRTANNVQFWLPVSFPPVPKKGDFDVRRLKESQYFFS